MEEDKEYVPTLKEKLYAKVILSIHSQITFAFIIDKLMISHNSVYRMRWDLIICVLAMYNCFSIPVTVAFQPEATLGMDIWERFLDVAFAFDLLINFRTTYVNSKTGFEVIDWKKIAVHYIITG
jgi:hypothetical protein